MASTSSHKLLCISRIYVQGALYDACSRGDLAAVKDILADVPGGRKGESAFLKACPSALHKAAEGGHQAIVVYLLDEEGLSIETTDHAQCTALHWCAFAGHLDLVKYLVHRGANIRAKNNFLWTPQVMATTSIEDRSSVIAFLQGAVSAMTIKPNVRQTTKGLVLQCIFI